MQIVGVILILGGLGILGWWLWAHQVPARAGPAWMPRPAWLTRQDWSERVEAPTGRRRRVRFERTLHFTAPVVTVQNGSPFALAPDDRDGLRRMVSVLWLIILITVAAAAVALTLFAIGALITNAITSSLENL